MCVGFWAFRAEFTEKRGMPQLRTILNSFFVGDIGLNEEKNEVQCHCLTVCYNQNMLR